jgi:cysteinyl-tRNA synthetase
MKLFDTKSGELRDFAPIRPNHVGIYVCGPTVQGAPHIGHLRSALAYDILTRWLTAKGMQVTLIRNVTDIDDKVLEKAVETGISWWSIAYANESLFSADYDRLGLLRPSYEPRATGHIPQMQKLISRLVDLGFAYLADDDSGDVYFDTVAWSKYGELTNQKVSDMDSESETVPATKPSKRNPTDFALWKGHKASEPEDASWDFELTGAGRPGWHIECSAMAMHYLGTNFDIHGGGLDLRFPHHENELAQSAAAGHEYANYWLHNGLVQVAGQKMSKSLANSVSAADLYALAPAAAVRYYLSSAQYRSTLDYQPGVLAEASIALDRIFEFLRRSERLLAKTKFSKLEIKPIPTAFASAMDDDLNVPGALAVLHETVRSGNAALDEERIGEAQQARGEVSSMLEVLGLSPESWEPSATEADLALDRVIAGLIEDRNQARAERDFAKADQIRDQLARAGIALSDDSDGSHWSIG